MVKSTTPIELKIIGSYLPHLSNTRWTSGVRTAFEPAGLFIPFNGADRPGAPVIVPPLFHKVAGLCQAIANISSNAIFKQQKILVILMRR